MPIKTLSLAAALALCAALPVHAKDAAPAPSRCVGIAGASACAAGVVNLNAMVTVERSSAKDKVDARQPARNPKPGKATDPEREIWRHHGVG